MKIGRRAGFDLLGERRACRVGNGRLPGAFLCPFGVGRVECVLEAGGGEDGDRIGGRRRIGKGGNAGNGDRDGRFRQLAQKMKCHGFPPISNDISERI